MRNHVWTKFAILVISLSFPAFAGLSEGKHAFDEGNYQTALKHFKPLAESGSAEAQSYVGDMYASGWGVGYDPAQAVTWYRLAARKGDAKAQCGLGSFYATGIGVPRDDMQGFKWEHMSAEQGFP